MDRSPDTTFQHGQSECAGILLTNLGTPDEPTPAALRRYLAEFLWDPRIIEIPRPLWWLILHGIILRVRPPKVAVNYQKIWTDEGSPLLAISRHQAAALRQRLAEQCLGTVAVAVGMRYGNPSIEAALDELREAHARRILLLPLYPQYSAATTASTFDAVAKTLRDWRWLPELRMVNHYHDHPGYIDALVSRIEVAWSEQAPAEKLLMSFHGVPKATLMAGDPYHCECHKTARLVAERLDLSPERWAITFQSRFGKAEWLKPYTSETLKDWAAGGVKTVDVICPGFSADCLETLEEIQEENRHYFLEAGGEQLRYIPALNDSPKHIDALVDLIMQHTRGWPEMDHTLGIERSDIDRLELPKRAMAMGAAR